MKARKMWAICEQLGEPRFTLSAKREWPYEDIPVLVIPLDEKSVAALVERVAKADMKYDLGLMQEHGFGWESWVNHHESAQAALAAIGIKAVKRKAAQRKDGK